MDQDLEALAQLRRSRATVLEDRPVVALGLETALADVSDAAGVVLVGRVPQRTEAIRAAAARGQHVVVLLDDADRTADAAAALDAGARGVALTSGTIAELTHVVRSAVHGRVAVASAMSVRLEALQQLRSAFTARELEVLTMYATGLPAKLVARRMGVGLETVKTYVKRLRTKAEPLGIPTTTRMELVDLARRLDLL